MRSLLVPVLILAVGCKSFGGETSEPDASVETPDAAPPCPNGALRFDGKAFVNVDAHPAFDSPSDLTVEAWIFPETRIGDGPVDIVSHHDERNSDGWVLGIDKGLVFRMFSGSGNPKDAPDNMVFAIDDSLTLGVWHHVAAVFDAADKAITLFIDGVSKGRNIRSKTMADPYIGPIAIGASAYIGQHGFDGIIDEVLVTRTVRHKGDKSITPVYPLPDGEEGTIGTWHFGKEKPLAEVANDSAGKFKSALATYDSTKPQLPVPVVPSCPTGATP